MSKMIILSEEQKSSKKLHQKKIIEICHNAILTLRVLISLKINLFQFWLKN